MNDRINKLRCAMAEIVNNASNALQRDAASGPHEDWLDRTDRLEQALRNIRYLTERSLEAGYNANAKGVKP